MIELLYIPVVIIFGIAGVIMYMARDEPIEHLRYEHLKIAVFPFMIGMIMLFVLFYAQSKVAST